MNPRKIVLAGGSGFMGGLLAAHFEKLGWTCVVLTRHTPQPPQKSRREVQWDGMHRGAWESALEGAEVVVNLCGQSVNCRYHARNRLTLMESRVRPTRLLGEVMAEMKTPPKVWLNASTATLYRHTFGDPWDEDGEVGAHPDAKDAFSIDLAQAWEVAFQESVPEGVRPVLLRSAMVLGRGKDANNVLSVLRRLTRLGLGGRMGHGRQFVSWIHERDLCRALEWIVGHEALEGVVNVCAPNPLPNQEMMRLLRKRLNRPFGLPAPAWALELGAFFLRTETELIIKSRRVVPGKLIASGFQFDFPEFGGAIDELL
ncbi:MAG: TIGR01777 family oxidoreductase [Verrucomicrobia bacterium]|nr:TIGR01777 family oxidoreductase [Verrucomicrobiota bacterium]MCH8511528.1 TIGR01777 family oxidoreductase [Kiritimatiellia bacterium]